MTTIGVIGECFFCYRFTRVVPDKIQRAVKWLCVLFRNKTGFSYFRCC